MALLKACSVGRVMAVCAAMVFMLDPSLAADERRPGEVFRDCPKCPELVVVPAGNYLMGKDGGSKKESPAHRVTIGSAFAIGKYEVTFDEWEVCIEEGGCGVIISGPAPQGKREVSFAEWKACLTDDKCQAHPDDHKWGRGRRPVMNINFSNAENFVQWLSRKTKKTYRLPTEAEWEYAARGGTTTVYSWGDEAGTDNANCRTCAPTISHKTFPVGSYKPNPFGLYDVHGNVWEWVQDCWLPSHEGAPADGTARLSGACKYRTTRSGSWYYVSTNVRSTYRARFNPRAFSYGIGLRVLREQP
jgi:formylglycine-generating enzyme required for sulfatase activity